MGNKFWPQEWMEVAEPLWRDGISASKIAETLNRQFEGASLSRNAVIARMHRAGIASGGKPKAKPAAGIVRAPRPDKPRRAPKQSPTFPVARAEPEPGPIGGVGILDLDESHCRYMLSTDRYCGATIVQRAYCLEHALRCYEAPRR